MDKKKTGANFYHEKQADRSVDMTLNPSYSVVKECKNIEQCDYVFQDSKYDTIKMRSNPSYGEVEGTVLYDTPIEPVTNHDVTLQKNPSYGSDLQPPTNVCTDQYSYATVKSSQFNFSGLKLTAGSNVNDHSQPYDSAAQCIKLQDNPSYAEHP